MARLVVGALLLFMGFVTRLAGVTVGGGGGRSAGATRAASFGFLGHGIPLVLFLVIIGDLRMNLQQH